MNEQEGSSQKKPSKSVSVKGVLLLVCGICLLWYSVVAIQQYRQVSNSADLSLANMWNYEGSLAWWTNACISLFFPLTSVFITLAGIFVVSKPLIRRLKN